LGVHLIFDKAKRPLYKPKQFEPEKFEHVKWYSKNNTDHQHSSFSPETDALNSWQEPLYDNLSLECVINATEKYLRIYPLLRIFSNNYF